jgi:hypothetical protein
MASSVAPPPYCHKLGHRVLAPSSKSGHLTTIRSNSESRPQRRKTIEKSGSQFVGSGCCYDGCFLGNVFSLTHKPV